MRVLLAARDAFGALGGIEVLKENFDLVPDAISGLISSSPLLIRELEESSTTPIVNSMDVDLEQVSRVLI